MTVSRRPHMPLSVKLHAALLALGFTDEEITGGGIEWDHSPCLALRFVDPETGQLVPHPNDPQFIRPLRKADHKAKTNGRRGEKRVTSAGSDIHAIARSRRLVKAEKAHAEAMADKAGGQKPHKPGSISSHGFPKGRKQKIPSRPFQPSRKRQRAHQTGD